MAIARAAATWVADALTCALRGARRGVVIHAAGALCPVRNGRLHLRVRVQQSPDSPVAQHPGNRLAAVAHGPVAPAEPLVRSPLARWASTFLHTLRPWAAP